MADTTETAVKAQLRKADRVWNDRTGWDAVYNDAYEYAIPNRKPGKTAGSKRIGMKLFDMTAPTSVMHGASTLVRQLIPPGQDPFILNTGPLVRSRLPVAQATELDRQLAVMAKQIYPFFQAGDFDAAMHTTAIDLFVGTGAIMPMRGPSIEEPLIFVNIPIDEMAIAVNAWGRVHFMSWRREAGYEEILTAWPDGNFDEDFRNKAKSDPYGPVLLYQDFYQLSNGWWRFVAYTNKSQDFIVTNTTRTKPVATPRFYRAPGEPYGRGPILMAMPTIKTANKAQEIALKGAAIQMLGIWGYRAGGTFNPDAVRVGPGEMWAMQSTGGLLGPDVSRLDPPNARMDIARMVIAGQQDQIREALLDHRIIDDGRTPASASQIAAQVHQNSQGHVGAYGSIVRELMPCVVARSIEILNDWGIMRMPLPVNELLYSVGVVSPMASALKADRLMATIQYVEMTNALFDLPHLDKVAKRQQLLDAIRLALMIDPELVPSEAEVQQAQQDENEQQAAAVAAEGAVRAAPQLVQAATQPQAAA